MQLSQLSIPWVTFCISTYRRPHFLKNQIDLLLKQSNKSFEIVISDNDSEGTGSFVVESFADNRIRYFKNDSNLGMISSFNLSIDRATTPFIIMVTDDDPVGPSFLEEALKWINAHPGLSLYGGFKRVKATPGAIEIIGSTHFMNEILDPDKTSSLLWSSCILNRADAISIGKIPDFGSPHLADHAFLAMTGSVSGAVVVNQMFSSLTLHDENFSKFNFDYYVKGCAGFYNTLISFTRKMPSSENKIAIEKHLHKWFISNVFNLKKYYLRKNNKEMLRAIELCGQQILDYSFMKKLRPLYSFKKLFLIIKWKLGIIK